MSAVFGHCQMVYAKMEEESKPDIIDGIEVQVYEGYLTRLFNDLNLAVPYYTTVMRELRRMDCVRQVRRGGGTACSMWMLLQSPVEEHFRAASAKSIKVQSGRTTIEQLRQMVLDVNARVALLEERVS